MAKRSRGLGRIAPWTWQWPQLHFRPAAGHIVERLLPTVPIRVHRPLGRCAGACLPPWLAHHCAGPRGSDCQSRSLLRVLLSNLRVAGIRSMPELRRSDLRLPADIRSTNPPRSRRRRGCRRLGQSCWRNCAGDSPPECGRSSAYRRHAVSVECGSQAADPCVRATTLPPVPHQDRLPGCGSDRQSAARRAWRVDAD